MRFLFCLALILLAALPARSQTEVELELVLLADASSSIRGSEFDLQVGGYARAFRDPTVIAAIQDLGGNGIAVTFVQWSATFQQFDTVPWQRIRTGGDAAAFADEIEAQARKVVSFGTATGSALEYGGQLFEGNGFAGKRRVIDLSSDEHSNQGPHPRGVRPGIIARGITINGLAILDDDFDLAGYFRDAVIGGPESFVMVVDGYADFAEAVRRKLVREISGRPVAELHQPRLRASYETR
ncbi:MAG: DUF1194 domain-containing protein [Paracoccaceae bacterium]|nr:DUF1194 domain-containing protein [Paracoccaceae bacterium]